MRQIEFVVPASVTRRVFPSWSIDIPGGFEETFVEEESYWHAWDEHRSVSLTSLALTDKGRPVLAEEIVRQVADLAGTPVGELPPGLVGRGAVIDAEAPARASRALTGLLAVDGRVLLVTITGDDLGWSRKTWLSIRHHPKPLMAAPSRAERRLAERKRGRTH